MHDDETPSRTETGDPRGPSLIHPRDVDTPPLTEPAPPVPSDAPATGGAVASSVPMAIPIAIPVQTDDEEIYCPLCNYNLTGVYSGRCPECGAFFDRQALIATQRANRVTIIPWDDPQPMSFTKRLTATVSVCLFSPKRFAVAFSVQPQRTKALPFFLGVVAVVALAFSLAVIVALMLDDSSGFSSSLHESILIATACALFPILLTSCTTLLSAATLWLTSPHYDGERHFRPWLSICAYAASHYLLVLCAVPCVALGLFTFSQISVLLIGLVLYGSAGLCGFTLIAVMKHRTAKDRRSTLGFLMLLAIHFVVPFLVLFITIGIVSLLETILRF